MTHPQPLNLGRHRRPPLRQLRGARPVVEYGLDPECEALGDVSLAVGNQHANSPCCY
jgi:hypothetical protein